jgi:hypothetical protein
MFAPAKSLFKPTPQVNFRTLAKCFQPSQNKLSLVFSKRCGLFVTSKKVMSFEFSNFQTLLQNTGGGGYLTATLGHCSRLKHGERRNPASRAEQ